MFLSPYFSKIRPRIPISVPPDREGIAAFGGCVVINNNTRPERNTKPANILDPYQSPEVLAYLYFANKVGTIQTYFDNTPPYKRSKAL